MLARSNSTPWHHERQNSSPDEGAIFWYEEETIEGEDTSMIMYEDNEFTEVTYESECPTEDDILLGTLPPAPPLADVKDLKTTDFASEQTLLDAMRSKRDEKGKTAVPGTDCEPALPKQKVVHEAPTRPKPLQHHYSPTGVWHLPVQEDIAGNKTTRREEMRRRRAVSSPRLQRVDKILLRRDERLAFSLASADPHKQQASLRRFWLERIEHQLCSMQRQLVPLQRELMVTEKDLALIRRKKASKQEIN